MENLSELDMIVSECPPSGSALSQSLVSLPPAHLTPFPTEGLIPAFCLDLQNRIWILEEDPDLFAAYLNDNDELAESLTNALMVGDDNDNNETMKSWWRTTTVMQALFLPTCKEYERISKDMKSTAAAQQQQQHQEPGQDGMMQEGENADRVLWRRVGFGIVQATNLQGCRD